MDRIGIQFTLHDDETDLDYTDTLWFDSLPEVIALSKANLEAMKQERFNHWKDSFNTEAE